MKFSEPFPPHEFLRCWGPEDVTMNVEELAEEITALEQRLAEAQQLGNRAALHHLVAADYSGVNAQGHLVDRELFINTFTGPGLMLESVRLENISVRVFEHTAVTTGTSHAHGYAHERPFRARYRFTNVWVRRIMHWQLVAGHVSVAA